MQHFQAQPAARGCCLRTPARMRGYQIIKQDHSDGLCKSSCAAGRLRHPKARQAFGMTPLPAHACIPHIVLLHPLQHCESGQPITSGTCSDEILAEAVELAPGACTCHKSRCYAHTSAGCKQSLCVQHWCHCAQLTCSACWAWAALKPASKTLARSSPTSAACRRLLGTAQWPCSWPPAC